MIVTRTAIRMLAGACLAVLASTAVLAPTAVLAAEVSAYSIVYPYWGPALEEAIQSSNTDAPPFNPSAASSVSNAAGSATASSDLVTGAMRGTATAVSQNAGFRLGQYDTFHFNIDGATDTTLTQLGLLINFQAALQGDGQLELVTGLSTQRGLYTAQYVNRITFGRDPFLLNGFSSVEDGVVCNCAFDDLVISETGMTASNSYMLNFTVLGANPSLGFGTSVVGYARPGSSLDFGHSVHYAFVLPEGATYTSDSGVSFTQTGVSAVPEPATWTMMLLGFAGAGSMLRGRARLAARRAQGA